MTVFFESIMLELVNFKNGLKNFNKIDVIFFLLGVGIYLGLLYLVQVAKADLQIFMLILAPVSILGMVSEVINGVVENILVVSVISLLQGYIYVRIGRFFNAL